MLTFWTTHNLKDNQISCNWFFFLFLLTLQNKQASTNHQSYRLETPPMGFFKLNIDGSACGNSSRAIAGGLTRNCKVAWIEGFFFFFSPRSIGLTHSMVIELWGLWDGLALTNNLNIRKLLIKIDAKCVISMLTSYSPMIYASDPCSALIFYYKSLVQLFDEAYIHREGE